MPRGRKKTASDVKAEEKTVEALTSAPEAVKPQKPAKKVKEKEVKETLIIQSAGVEWDVSEIKEKVISSYVAEGHRRGRISDLTLYIKPEEKRIYYVINGKAQGSVDIT